MVANRKCSDVFDESEEWHKKLQAMLQEMAEYIGLKSSSEIIINQSHRLDVAWYARFASSPSVIFEISALRDIHKAFSRLKDSRIMFGRPLLFLIVSKDKDKEKAKQILRLSFPEMTEILKIWTTTDLKDRYTAFEKYSIFMAEFFPYRHSGGPHIFMRKIR
jgi:hypothetical protein